MSITKITDSDGNEVTTYTGVDLQNLKASLLDALGPTNPGCCVCCKEPFSDKNVFTAAGWSETRLSHTCEKCWDEMWRDK